MPEIIRNRKIRPSSRLDSSVNYRVHLDAVAPADTLVVNITHESKSFTKTFRFKGSDVLKKKRLGFKVIDDGKHIEIKWISTQPLKDANNE